MHMREIQEQILENKRRHGFNTTIIEQEFCYLNGEIREAYEAYCKELDNFPEELADVAIFLMGISEIQKVDLATEILRKIRCKNVQEVEETDMLLRNAQTGETMLMRDAQREICEDKAWHVFKTASVEQKFCNLYCQVAEAYEVYYKGRDTFAEELANVAIYLMGLAEINGIDLGAEIIKKVEKNKSRQSKRNKKGYVVHL